MSGAASLAGWRPGPSATAPPEARGVARDAVRLLVSRGGGHEHARFHDLPEVLPEGTLLVVNASATLPAALPASARFGTFVLNLSTRYGERLWLAEPRRSEALEGPVPLLPGERFEAAGCAARVLAPFPGVSRLLFVAFDGSIERAMADEGEPIRYAHLSPPFPPLAAFQTVFAEVPGSAEMPSAARPFTPDLLAALRRRGIRTVPVVLHAGVSSLEGDEAAFVPEPFAVSPAAAGAINEARRSGRPVVAVGTTVVRALASAWDGVRVRAAEGFTRRFVHPGRPVRAIDGLISGFHEPAASHLAMLEAVGGAPLVRDAYRRASAAGYLWHEFGDSHLILPGAGAGGAYRLKEA
jgi:S-adenosylmethionine:tRNA ribosyltransferase-isomerase